MKRLLWVGALCIIGVNKLSAQGDEYFGQQQQYFQKTELLTNPTVQTPQAAAFQKVNFIPVSNYTGRTNISIPIFTIKSGNITVPITLSYNSSGVKVNDIPSSVGSNWSLNAGGTISKVVRGMDDFADTGYSPLNLNTYTHMASPAGWLRWKYTKPRDFYDTGVSHHIVEPAENDDPQPDLFIVSAPGLNTRYTHTVANAASGAVPFTPGTGGEVFELSGQKNKIEETVNRVNILGSFVVAQQVSGSNAWQYHDGAFLPSSNTSLLGRPNPRILGINTIKVTSLSGMEYQFNDFDVSQFTSIEENVNSTTLTTFNPAKWNSNLKIESYNLSKIKDHKSNKEVNFEYEKYYKGSYDPIDDTSYINGAALPFNMDSKIDAKSVKYPQIHRLKKITYDKGSVEFIYGLNRQDVTDEKALTQIIIKDINGVIIKKLNLQYTYFTNTAYAATAQNKRLRLDKVYSTNAQNEALPGYNLTYNTTGLPPRGTWGQDFLGYSNGTYNTSVNNAKPHMYFYPDSGKESILPINKGSGYYYIGGTYSLASNLTHSKAGILTKIEYPTGGSSEFEYELNQFKISSATITGGGLRIKTQHLKDEHGNAQILDYQYTETNNMSSGSIVSFANYVDLKVKTGYTPPLSIGNTTNHFSFKVYRTSQAQAELTKGAFVGYARVIVKNRVNNGYMEYIYNAPKDFPNALPTRVVSPLRPAFSAIANTAARNGTHSYTIDNDIKRGNLVHKRVYDKHGSIKTHTHNQYTYKKFASIDYNHNIKISNAHSHYDFAHGGGYQGPYLQETVSIPNERYVLTQSVTTNYLDGGNTAITKQIIYDPVYPLIKENKIIDNTKTVHNKYYYPHDSQVSSLAYMNNLKVQNRYSEMIQQEAYHDGQKIFTERISYHNFGNNLYLPNKIFTAKGANTLEEGAIIDQRDSNGNILQYHTKDGIYTSFIYGYGNTVLVAKIENATYSSAVNALPISISQLQNLDSASDKNILMGYFTTLRNALPNARVTSYTYIPGIGVQTITGNRGKTVSYVYDNFHRLKYVKDLDGNVIKEHNYHYKN